MNEPVREQEKKTKTKTKEYYQVDSTTDLNTQVFISLYNWFDTESWNNWSERLAFPILIITAINFEFTLLYVFRYNWFFAHHSVSQLSNTTLILIQMHEYDI